MMVLFAEGTPAQAAQQLMTPGVTMVWVLIGILISLVLPLAVRVLKKASTALEGVDSQPPTVRKRMTQAWNQYAGTGIKYAVVLAAAVLVAVVLVFLLGLEFYTKRDAALAGFAWESLINKLFGRQKPAEE